MSVKEANFQDLCSFYYERQTVLTARDVLLEMITRREHLQLAALLRDHHRRAVYSSRERYLRACVDDLLLCCDVFEIGALTNFIPAPDPDKSDFWQAFRTILNNKQVKNYIEVFYPVKLPPMLSLRLQGRSFRIASDNTAITSYVLQFLALDLGFMNKLNDGYLLSMLDSFTIQGYRFRDVVRLIGNPRVFIERILLPPMKRSIPDLALQELGQLLQFAVSLHDLLGCLDEHPLVQSAIWNHYSYWFEIIGKKLQRQLGVALDQFLIWKPISADEMAALEIQEYVARARTALEALTSHRYSSAVDEIVQPNMLG